MGLLISVTLDKLSNINPFFSFVTQFLADNSKIKGFGTFKSLFAPINMLIPIILTGSLNSIGRSEAELGTF